jgi:hypothetical protein
MLRITYFSYDGYFAVNGKNTGLFCNSKDKLYPVYFTREHFFSVLVSSLRV